jgi:hypothetical protein
MNKITEYFSQLYGLKQKDVDFVNVYLGIDNPLFLDFNKILADNSKEFRRFRDSIFSYMEEMISELHANKSKKLLPHVSGLHETNFTFLGLSSGDPKGNSVGIELKKNIIDALQFLKRVMIKGNLDIDTIFLGIENINADRISDIITSIIKRELIIYTQEQCRKHAIPCTKMEKHIYFDITTKTWKEDYFNLPEYNQTSLILIPKRFISTYNQISGTIGRFITISFNKFYKKDSETIRMINKEEKNRGDIKRKDFEKWRKDSNLTDRKFSQKIFSEMPNSVLVNVLGDLRNQVYPLSDFEIEEIIEANFKKRISYN